MIETRQVEISERGDGLERGVGEIREEIVFSASFSVLPNEVRDNSSCHFNGRNFSNLPRIGGQFDRSRSRNRQYENILQAKRPDARQHSTQTLPIPNKGC